MPRLAAVIAVLLLFVASPAPAQCLTSGVNCNQQGVETAAPSYTTTCPGGAASAFDIPAATLDQDAPNNALPFGNQSLIFLRDEFTVHGPAVGLPVDLHLRVHAQGLAFAGGGFGDTAGLILTGEAYPPVVGESPVQRAWGTFDGTVAFDDSLDIVLHRTTGVPAGIQIESNLGAAPGCHATAHLRFRFVGLPPGYTVTSCKGYAQEQPVPARPVSWGTLKAAYR